MNYKVYRRKTECRLTELPTDLLTNILSRLSVKIILQLRTVCKTWYQILTDSRFITMHANWCATNQYGYLTCFPRCQKIIRKDEDLELLEILKIPRMDSSSLSSKFDVIGSCNGLLCLTKKTNVKHQLPSTYLWNPCIRAYKKLPEITHPQYRRNASCVSGFGYDSRTDDYKVFHTVLTKLNKKEKLRNIRKSSESLDYVIINQLYSLKTDSWKVIELGYDDDYDYDYDSSTYPFGCRRCQAYFDGAFYWIPTSRLTYIMWFDFCDEKLRKAKLPIELADVREKFICVRQLSNKLALFTSETVFGSVPCTFDAWMMRKKILSSDVTWDRAFSISMVVHPAAAAKIQPVDDMFYYSESMFSQESWTRYENNSSSSFF